MGPGLHVHHANLAFPVFDSAPAPSTSSARLYKVMETKPIAKASANEVDKGKYQEIREYRKSVLNWLRTTVKHCTGVEQFANLDDVDLFQSLRHGVILCKIIQCIEPSILPKIPDERPYPSIFGASMNIAEFLKACRKLGVPPEYLCKVTSIVDGKQLSSLVKILTSLALIGNKSGNTPQFSQEDGQRILQIWPHGEAAIEETTEIGSPLLAQKLSYEISTLSAKIDMLDSSHRILFSRVSHVQEITESVEKKYIESTAKLDRLTAGLMDSWDHFSKKISNIEETQTAILKNLEKITELVVRENTASVLPRKSKDGADQASSIDASTETLDSGHGGSMTDISQPPPTSPPRSPIKEPESNPVSRARQPTNSSEYSLNQSWNSSVKLSRLPPEFGALNLSRSDYLRQESIYELIETERDYVQDLSTLLSCQVADLQRYVMAPDNMKKLIGNIDEIVVVNQHFLSLLDDRRKTSLIINKIGDVISQKAKSLETSYAEYSKSYPTCLQYLQQLKSQEEVRLCLEKWNTAPGIKGLSLESFLIKPIQRITKYPLIIRQIQQYTSRDHEDYSLLESALISCEQVVEAVNQKTNMYGQMEKVIMLKSMIQGFSEINVEGRKLIRDGEVMRLHSIRSRQPYYFILFEDLFVICKPGKVKGQFRVDAQVCPSKILVKSSREEYKTQTLELLFIGEKREVKIFATHTLADKTAWINSLQNEISRISMKLSTSPNPLDRVISRDDSSLSVSSVNTDISMPESPVSEEKRKSLKLKKRRIVSSASSIRSAKQGFQQRNRIPSFTTSSAPPSHVENVATAASQSVTVDNTMGQQTEKSSNTSVPTSPAKSSSNLPSQLAFTTTALSASIGSSATSTTPGVTAAAATSSLANPTEVGQNTLSFPALALSITLYVPQDETQIGFQTNTYIRIIGINGSEHYEVEMNGVKGQIPVSTVILLSRQATPDWDDRLKTCDSDEGTSRLIFWKKQSEEISRSRTSTMESNDMDLSSITSPELVEINGQIWKQQQAETGQLYYFNTSDKTQCILTLPTHYLIVNPKTGKKFDPWSDVGDVLASIPEEKESSAKPIENKPTKSEGNEKTEEGKRNENTLAVPEEIPSHPGWKKFKTQNGESYFLHEESHRVSFHVLPE